MDNFVNLEDFGLAFNEIEEIICENNVIINFKVYMAIEQKQNNNNLITFHRFDILYI